MNKAYKHLNGTISTNDEDYGVCPYCKAKYEAFELQDFEEMTCDECGGEFTVEREYSCSYNSTSLKAPTNLSLEPVWDEECQMYACPRCHEKVGGSAEGDKAYVEEKNKEYSLLCNRDGTPMKKKMHDNYTSKEEECPDCHLALEWTKILEKEQGA
ncbi:MAG: hypothetical protein R3Y63_08740 [Eubacteriales bacterium]